MSHQYSKATVAGNPLLTASLTAKVSNLKSLSEAYKELEKNRHGVNDNMPPSLEVKGKSTVGVIHAPITTAALGDQN